MTISLWPAFIERNENPLVAVRSTDALHVNDILAEASRVATTLEKSQEPIFLYCEDSANFLAGLIGAATTGRTIMLPGHATPGYLAEIGVTSLNLVTDIKNLPNIALVNVVAKSSHRSDITLPQPDTAIGFYTSGTSGQAKAQLKHLSQLVAEVATHLSLWGKPQGLVLGTVSHQHIYGLLFRLLWPLAAACPFKAEQLELWEAVDQFCRSQCVLVSSPAHLSRLPAAFRLSHPASAIFSSGAPLSAEAAQDTATKLGAWPTELLGSTETGGVAWRQQKTTEALWTPLPGVHIKQASDGALAVSSPYADANDFVTMGDAVAIEADGRFALRERLDRIVKIEGKRVSLQRVEGALRALPEIDDAVALDLPDRRGALGAVVTLSPKGEALLQAKGKFRLTRQLRSDLANVLEPMERPRFWRLVSSIPVNAQGKRVKANLQGLFYEVAASLPHIGQETISDDKAIFELELKPDLCWFGGHFPARPILPGVAQIHIASELAHHAWGFRPAGREMSRIKFRHVMQPGDHIVLLLVRKGFDRLDFEYIRAEEVMAAGTIRGET